MRDPLTQTEWVRILSRTIWGIALAVIVVSTLGLGGGHTGFLLATRLLVIIGALILAVNIRFRPAYLSYLPNSLLAALALSVCFVVYTYLQAALGHGIFKTGFGSAYSWVTWESGHQILTYVLFFFIAFEAVRNRERLERLLEVVGLFSCGVIFFALIQSFARADKVYWTWDVGTTTFFGPFIYENNFGAFVALTLPMMLAMAIYRFVLAHRALLTHRRGVRGFFSTLLEFTNSGAGFFVVVAFLALLASLISRSRAPAASMLMGLTVALIAVGVLGRKKWVSVLLGALLGGLILLARWIGFERVFLGFDPDKLEMESQFRIQLVQAGLEAFKRHLWFGSGQGTFGEIVDRYLASGVQEYAAHTHPCNEYVGLLAESGVLGAVVLLLALGALMAGGAYRSLQRKSAWLKTVSGQAVMALFTFGFMLLFDSHLKTPSIAYLFLLQIAVLVQSGNKRLDRAGAHEDSAEQLRKKRFSPAASTAIVTFLCASSFILIVPTGVRWTTEAWANQANITSETQPLERAISLAPDRAGFWNFLSDMREKFALEVQSRKASDEYLAAAVESRKKTIELTPLNAEYWYLYGRLVYAARSRTEAMGLFEKTVELAPGNRKYRVTLISAYIREATVTRSSTLAIKYRRLAADAYRSLLRLPKPVEGGEWALWGIEWNPAWLAELESLKASQN